MVFTNVFQVSTKNKQTDAFSRVKGSPFHFSRVSALILGTAIMRHPGGQEGLPQPDPDGAERQEELCL